MLSKSRKIFIIGVLKLLKEREREIYIHVYEIIFQDKRVMGGGEGGWWGELFLFEITWANQQHIKSLIHHTCNINSRLVTGPSTLCVPVSKKGHQPSLGWLSLLRGIVIYQQGGGVLVWRQNRSLIF